MRPLLLSSFLFSAAASAAVLEVRSPAELKSVLGKVAAGDVLKIFPGEYPGGNAVSGIAKLTVEAGDAAQPPHFKGGALAWHFTRCPGLTLRHLKCSGQSANGFNLDDGGADKERMTGVTLTGLEISDIGPDGNFDGIKCSGLDDLTIRDCSVSGWGGQAIDLVGCHRVLITGCRFTGKPGFSQHTGPQFKGGSEDGVIENCEFLNAGGRPIQAGGSTGTAYFRPLGAKFEARRIIIRNNRIEGGDCACTFTGVDGGEFSGNTVLRPAKWIFRILTENRTEGFPPSRNVLISKNHFTYRRADVRVPVNIGGGTAPETFKFDSNTWHAEDRPGASKPELPVAETNGTYGQAQPPPAKP
ncbi:MAG: right-handed parallel beta-helix repeat-containing protein [Verrucomicrobiota bacterium]